MVQDYFIEMNGSCMLAFVEQPTGYWLLGDAFLMGYYSIHDNSNHAAARVGFAPAASSFKHDIQVATTPEFDQADLTWERTWIHDLYWLV